MMTEHLSVQMGWTPLRIAANMANQGVACAKILLDNGADIEATLGGDVSRILGILASLCPLR